METTAFQAIGFRSTILHCLVNAPVNVNGIGIYSFPESHSISHQLPLSRMSWGHPLCPARASFCFIVVANRVRIPVQLFYKRLNWIFRLKVFPIAFPSDEIIDNILSAWTERMAKPPGGRTQGSPLRRMGQYKRTDLTHGAIAWHNRLRERILKPPIQRMN